MYVLEKQLFPEQVYVALQDYPRPLQVAIAAIYLLFLNNQKCLDWIFIYLWGLMISIGNLRLMNHDHVEDS